MNAWRHADGSYHPLETVDILLLGDIMELQNTTLWLDKARGEPGYVRPWTDPHTPEFAARVDSITRAILQHNAASLAILKALTLPGGSYPPPVGRFKNAEVEGVGSCSACRCAFTTCSAITTGTTTSPAPAFDSIRRRIVDAFGLHNSDRLFPHALEESPELRDLLAQLWGLRPA